MGFWVDAQEALLLFPLTEPVRKALLQLMHAASPATPVNFRDQLSYQDLLPICFMLTCDN